MAAEGSLLCCCCAVLRYVVRSRKRRQAGYASPCHRENKWRNSPFFYLLFPFIVSKTLSSFRHPLRFSLSTAGPPSTTMTNAAGSGEGNARRSKRQRGGQADNESSISSEKVVNPFLLIRHVVFGSSIAACPELRRSCPKSSSFIRCRATNLPTTTV